MARRSRSNTLLAWMNGEHVGAWTSSPGKPDAFAYSEEWQASKRGRAISLSMPLRPTPYAGEVVTAFFDNLLPESKQIRERIRKRFEVSSTKPFDLLLAIGRDCVGAIQLLPADHPAPNPRRIDGARLTQKRIEALLRSIPSSWAAGPDDEDFRISLAGAQEKTALLRFNDKWMRPNGSTPSTHILKLPIGIANRGVDLSTSLENEWLCAQILKAYDVPTADCWIEDFGDQRALVVERFDRRMSSTGTWLVRLPQEDFCQATGTPADRKYEADGGPGIRRIMDILLGSSRAEADRKDFFKTQILFWMLCAIDGHGKNFSLFLEAGGGFRLTPRYDVLSAFPILGRRAGTLSDKKAKMAMAVEGRSRHYLWATILPRHWEEMARRCGLATIYPSLIEEVVDQTPGVVASVEARLPKNFPSSVAGPILDGLKKTCAILKQ